MSETGHSQWQVTYLLTQKPPLHVKTWKLSSKIPLALGAAQLFPTPTHFRGGDSGPSGCGGGSEGGAGRGSGTSGTGNS